MADTLFYKNAMMLAWIRWHIVSAFLKSCNETASEAVKEQVNQNVSYSCFLVYGTDGGHFLISSFNLSYLLMFFHTHN